MLETFLTILAYLAFMTFREGLSWPLWAWIWDNYLYLLSASLFFSVLLAQSSYFLSFLDGQILAEGGNTGNTIYDACRPLFRSLLSFPPFLTAFQSGSLAGR